MPNRILPPKIMNYSCDSPDNAGYWFSAAFICLAGAVLSLLDGPADCDPDYCDVLVQVSSVP